jgi:integrase
MAGEKLLTEAKCKAAKPKAKIYYLNDGGGLRLRIRPNGSRHWIYRYRIDKKEKSTSLGAYPQTSLQIARAKVVEAKKNVAEGYDPVVVRRVKRTQHAVAGEQSFGSVAHDWLTHNQGTWSSHHYERNEGLIRRYLMPDLGKLPIASIEESYLFAILKRVYDKGTKESARRARAVAAQIFSYGRATHRCTVNPAREMSDNPYFKKPPVKHFNAIGQDDVPELITQLAVRGEEQKLSMQVICGILMAIYTGLRDISIRGAQWKEIDFDSMLWTVSGDRMKSGREHQVPLPTQALAALRELEAITYIDPDSFVFASRGKNGYLSENTFRVALHRLGHKVTVHGMRSLITDVLSEREWNPDWIEKQLDHQEKNKVRAAYLRTKFLPQREKMMQWFADWCEGNVGKLSPNNVINMRGKD